MFGFSLWRTEIVFFLPDPSLPSHPSTNAFLSSKNAEVRADTQDLASNEEDSIATELYSYSTFEVIIVFKFIFAKD